eukprot:2419101-Amphidinium_carterae.1
MFGDIKLRVGLVRNNFCWDCNSDFQSTPMTRVLASAFSQRKWKSAYRNIESSERATVRATIQHWAPTLYSHSDKSTDAHAHIITSMRHNQRQEVRIR